MGDKENFNLTVSILSKGAGFSISNESDWRNKSGFLIALDNKVGQKPKHVFLKYCTMIVDGTPSDICDKEATKVKKT